MNLALTPSQAALRDSIARFAHAELNDALLERDRKQEFNRAGWRRCAQEGLLGMPIPARYGGRESTPLETAVAFEGLGLGCRDNGLCFAVQAQLWGCAWPLAAFGTDAQKRLWLPALCAGEAIGALAASEADAGSDAYAMQASATRRGEGYVLNGTKLYVTHAPHADLILLLARTDPEKGAHGISAFLVPANSPGLRLGPPQEKMGLRTVPMGQVHLEDCEVTADARLGAEGSGIAVFNHAMEWERGFIMASAVGAMQRQLDDCRARARSRRQFGQPIGGFQLISAKLSDMHLCLEASRLLLYKVAWLKTERKRAVMEAATAKLYISESWVRSCEDALQIHGAYGYLSESGIERELRDALASRLYSGTSEIQRQVIARWMHVA